MFTVMARKAFIHEHKRVKPGTPLRVGERTAALYLANDLATLVKPNENIERQARSLKADLDALFHQGGIQYAMKK
jgi:hypothetical protein